MLLPVELGAHNSSSPPKRAAAERKLPLQEKSGEQGLHLHYSIRVLRPEVGRGAGFARALPDLNRR